MNELKSRFYGSLLGLIVADAFSAPLRGPAADPENRVHFHDFEDALQYGLTPGQTTKLTYEVTLTLKSLLNNFEPEGVVGIEHGIAVVLANGADPKKVLDVVSDEYVEWVMLLIAKIMDLPTRAVGCLQSSAHEAQRVLEHSISFLQGLQTVVNSGHQNAADVAVLYGQLAGAHYGLMKIPWVGQLKSQPELSAIISLLDRAWDLRKSESI